MKKRRYIWILTGMGAGILTLTAFSLGGRYPNGAPAGYTGSPADAKDCTFCHGGNPTTVPGLIKSNVPAEGYTGGNTYTIIATVGGTGRKGFEVSPRTLMAI